MLAVMKNTGFTVAMIFGGKEWLVELQNIMSQVKSSSFD